MNHQTHSIFTKTSRLLALAALLLAVAQAQSPAPPAQAMVEDLRAQARAALAQTSGELKMAGLKRPVEVIRDAWGVPHIYAKTQADLFFAQGFVVAQDRLWQLDLWRRKAMGELAEIMGPEAVERDRYARLLRFRGDWRAEWLSYSVDTKPIVESFVRGINAYIEAAGDNLPVEFKLTGTRPGKWTPEVVVSRMAAYPMTGNASREMVRAMVVRALGAERTAQLFPTDPPRVAKFEDGLNLEGVDTSVTAGLERAAGEVNFDGESQFAEGSNNWTIAGPKTKSFKPILANDPHRALLLPSLRYIVHLVGPGWDVIGAGEPALPGISIGHNQRIAFGLTIFAADQQDIVVERLNDAGTEYFDPLGLGEWKLVEVVEESIAVKGEAAPRKVQLKFTRHGPVIYEDPKQHRAFVLRWVGTQPGTAGYLAGLAISRAKNWLEFREALKRWRLPPENFVYADVDGNIGYQAAATVPVRACDGLLPVRGDAKKCEWRGFLRLDELPHEFNPAQKFYATANNNTLAPDEKRLIGFEWASDYRVNRIREVLAAGNLLTVQDSEELQADITSLPARDMKRLIELLPHGACLPESNKSACAGTLLRSWNGRMERDSAEAAIFEVWLVKLREKVFRPLVPEGAWRAASRLISLPAMIRALSESDPAVFPSREGKEIIGPGLSFPPREKLLAQAMDEAIAELEKWLGSDMTKWRWGTLHTANFTHPLSSVKEPMRALAFDLGPVERGGDGATVNATSGGNYLQTAGASYRQVIDLSDWDKSTATNAPGQSGQPGSAHYDDLLKLWAREQHFPLSYSRAAVEKHAMLKLLLVPAK